jgi:hypothetical protein
MAKVDLTSFKKQMAKLEKELDDLPEAAHAEFIKNTPVRSGNARRNTQLRDTKIIANYDYSQDLEAGRSRQAPEGMIKPTEQWIQREVDRRLKGI